MKRVLVIGATGVFGERLARHLAAHHPFALTLTSRSHGRVGPLAHELGAQAAALDTRRGLDAVLRTVRPWAVVDCSGPFQSASHAVARAAIGAGAHALDLADAREYLLGYHDALDGPAHERGVAALGGASSTPGLSGAVARSLTAGWDAVNDLDIAIVPGGRGAVGRSVLRAVLSYAGRPVPQWRDGRPAEATGWRGGRTIRVPGLGPRRIADVETVDAERLGPLLAVRGSVRFGAGLESFAEQRGLEALAWLRAHGLPLPRALVPLLHRARDLTRLTTGDRGGMVVRARGMREGRRVEARWTLVAERGDGLQVPTLPAAAALRALAEGRIAPGARLADEVLTPADIEREARPYAISFDFGPTA